MHQRVSELEASEKKQKQMGKALIKQKSLLDEVFNRIQEGIGIVDENETILFCNPVFADIFEEDKDYIIGKNLSSFFDAESYLTILQQTENRKTGKTSTYELPIITKNGKQKYLRITVFPRFKEDDSYIGAFGAILDITKHKQIEEKLQFLVYAMEQSSEGIATIDMEDNILFVNKAFASMHNYTQEELIGEQLSIFHTPEQMSIINKINQQIKETGEFKGEIWHKRADGTVFPSMMHNALFRDDMGKPIGIIGTLRDITEDKCAAKEHEQLLTQIAEKNKELEQIIYITSHDLRSPLVIIQGFNELLYDNYNKLISILTEEDIPIELEEKLKPILKINIPKIIKHILKSTSKLNSLLTGFLQFARLGHTTFEIKKLDMNTFISNVINVLESQIKNQDVKLQIEELPLCYADELQLNQVFSNLIDNALKYLDPNRAGIIKISGYKEAKQITYCIEDNGIGISKEYQDKIFDIFYHIDSETTSGEGLGLAIAHKIINIHNGKIWVESELGKGSKFFISLPDKIITETT